MMPTTAATMMQTMVAMVGVTALTGGGLELAGAGLLVEVAGAMVRNIEGMDEGG